MTNVPPQIEGRRSSGRRAFDLRALKPLTLCALMLSACWAHAQEPDCPDDQAPTDLSGFLIVEWVNASTTLELTEGESATPEIRIKTKDDRPWACFPSRIAAGTARISVNSHAGCNDHTGAAPTTEECPGVVGGALAVYDYRGVSTTNTTVPSTESDWTAPSSDKAYWETTVSAPELKTYSPSEQTTQCAGRSTTDDGYTENCDGAVESARERLSLTVNRGPGSSTLMRANPPGKHRYVHIEDIHPVVAFGFFDDSSGQMCHKPWSDRPGENLIYERDGPRPLRSVVLTHPDMTEGTDCDDMIYYTSASDVVVNLEVGATDDQLKARVDLVDEIARDDLVKYYRASAGRPREIYRYGDDPGRGLQCGLARLRSGE